jgi:hypothetical protein
LTDYESQVQAALQYRAFELYRWHPNEKPTPVRPARYPENWREPQPDPKNVTNPLQGPLGRRIATQPVPADRDEGPVEIEKLRLWAGKPGRNHHRIIALMCDYGPISRDQLVKRSRRSASRETHMAITSLMTNKGSAYGLVFVDRAGNLYIHPDIEDTIRRLWDRYRTPKN